MSTIKYELVTRQGQHKLASFPSIAGIRSFCNDIWQGSQLNYVHVGGGYVVVDRDGKAVADILNLGD